MKRLLIILAATAALTGCVVADPYYVQPAPVYVQPAPVYIQPRPVYVPPPPRCYWVKQWNGYTRSYQNARVCR
jgi:hypothetical protein